METQGLQSTSTVTVDETNVASAVGSGSLQVFATPAMIALMENAAMRAVESILPEGATTVGTKMDVAHTRATAVGETVSATAVLEQTEGRKLTFHVVASDSRGVIGEGTHERFIVDVERFLAKLK